MLSSIRAWLHANEPTPQSERQHGERPRLHLVAQRDVFAPQFSIGCGERAAALSADRDMARHNGTDAVGVVVVAPGAGDQVGARLQLAERAGMFGDVNFQRAFVEWSEPGEIF